MPSPCPTTSMPRPKQSATPPAATETAGQEQITELIAAVDALTEKLECLEPLVGQVETLRIAIDDLREEVAWATRNMFRPAWTPTPQVTSLPKDPLAEDFHERVNRFTAQDLPPEPPAQLSSSPPPATPVEQGDLFG